MTPQEELNTCLVLSHGVPCIVALFPSKSIIKIVAEMHNPHEVSKGGHRNDLCCIILILDHFSGFLFDQVPIKNDFLSRFIIVNNRARVVLIIMHVFSMYDSDFFSLNILGTAVVKVVLHLILV